MLAKFLMVVACMAAAAFYLRFLIAIGKERQPLMFAYSMHLLRYQWRRDFSNQPLFLTDVGHCSVRIKTPQRWASPVAGPQRRLVVRINLK